LTWQEEHINLATKCEQCERFKQMWRRLSLRAFVPPRSRGTQDVDFSTSKQRHAFKHWTVRRILRTFRHWYGVRPIAWHGFEESPRSRV